MTVVTPRAGLVRASALRQMVAAHGGFTVDCRDGRTPADGISVCTRPSLTLAFPWEAWDDEIVDGWLAERAAEQHRRSHYIGGWLDPRSDMVWLDVVRVVSPRLREAAFLVGIANQQHCVFDLGRGETVALGEWAA